MTAKIIDGKVVAASIQSGVRADAELLKAQFGVTPGLATILVGENPASKTYVGMKQKTSQELGMFSIGSHLPADISQDELVKIVRGYAADPKIHGILVQLPLPAHLDQETVLGAIPIEKDVDGFHPINVGRLAMKNREPIFVPCTPAGVIVLIDSVGTKIEGARAVVLGRSNIVGLPAAFLLIHRNATVTVCHSRTQNLPDVVRQADIVVAAIGKAQFVKADWLKPGATVIDVGTNSIPDPTKKSGHRQVGDVDFEAAKEVAGAITPSPGGVGPMTIAMLMRNTCDSALRTAGLKK
ncbi:MAG: bifunctional 5,10-methylene-tetrahydrofolate dehydrogenase/5,10-methylene-tetrahydrofolate cyclohydrolase [Chloroflexi bacterium]|nr:bifunctional 5,10-methylene-tetrahydrofolate dehydrogenase/5,10-methylene-tetrahydrofolate cyclohydrolase [Chloroflexota bacterium]